MSTTVMAERYKTKVPPSLRSQFKIVNKPEAVNKYREGQKRASTRSVNILKDKDFEKPRNVLAAKRKSLIVMNTAKVTSRKPLRHSKTRMKMPSLR